MELLKVAGDDRDGEGHDQHPADGTHTPHQLEILGLRWQNVQVTFFFIFLRVFWKVIISLLHQIELLNLTLPRGVSGKISP